jgi:hypothetical protein
MTDVAQIAGGFLAAGPGSPADPASIHPPKVMSRSRGWQQAGTVISTLAVSWAKRHLPR